MDKFLLDSKYFYYIEISPAGDFFICNKLFEGDFSGNLKINSLYHFVSEQDHVLIINTLNDCIRSPEKIFQLELIMVNHTHQQTLIVWEMCGSRRRDDVVIKALGQKKEFDNEIWNYIENHKLTQQHYQSLFDQNADAVCSFDPLGNFITGNKSVETTSGYTISELKGTSIHRLFHPKDREITIACFENSVNGAMQNYEVRMVTKTGKIRFCNVTNVPIVLNNLIFGVYVVAKDITDRVLAENKIKRDRELMQNVQNELNLLVEELTYTNNDLRQFAYITSHNLRSPLSNLITIIDLLDRSSLDAYNNELIQLFQQSTQQLFNAVNDLMEILVIKNNVHVEKEQIELDKLLQEVILSISKTVEEAGGGIKTELDVNVVHFNRTYLESILLNLLTNSIKYRSPGRPLVINVRTRETTDHVVLVFSDNGIGIDIDRFGEKVFGLYQRFHNNADSKGLGLFIVKSQVTALGGKIDVNSAVDQGTTFTIHFRK